MNARRLVGFVVLATLMACPRQPAVEAPVESPAAGAERGQANVSPVSPPAESKTITAGFAALALVRADTWSSPTGTMALYRRAASGWEVVHERLPVTLGRSGLGWGRGLHKVEAGDGPVKKEGDGRTPAGVFVARQLLGTAAAPLPGMALPYQQSSETLRCVDDVASAHYNRIVDEAAVQKDWSSHEIMRRPDGLYDWVLMVDHNVGPPEPGGGSCIFLHVWRAADKPTAGCVAAPREQLESFLRDVPAQGLAFVVLPQAEYERRRTEWALP